MPNPTPQSRRWWPVFLIFVLGAIWGLHFSVIKVASESGLAYEAIAATTTLGIAIVLFGIGIARNSLPALNVRAIRFYAICAVLGYVIPFFTELYIARYLAAGVLTLVVSTTPLFTVVIALLSRSEHVSPRRALGIILGAASAGVILLPANALSDPEMSPWVVTAFVVPITYATYHNYVSRAWPAGSSTWQVACGEALAALVMLLPIYLWSGDFLSFRGPWSGGEWAILLMTCFGVIEVYLYFEIVRLAGAVFVSQASYVTIISGIFWGMVIFSERPDVWVWLSVGVLCAALYFVVGAKQCTPRRPERLPG